MDLIAEGRPSALSINFDFSVESMRAGELYRQARHSLYGDSLKDPSFCSVVQLSAAGEVWTKTGQRVSYDYCRSIEELNWHAEVGLQRLPTMIKLSESIAGINAMNREYYLRSSGWQNRHIFWQIFDYAYLIWGSQLAEFEELAARQLARQREAGSANVADLEKLIAYCRDTLKPDPDGLP